MYFIAWFITSPGLPISASFSLRSFLCSRSTRAFINPDPWKTNKREPTQIHQLKWKAIYPEQEPTPLLPDEWCWSLEPKEAATRKTFDNAAFMGAQHKGNTVSGGWVLPRHPDQRGQGSRLGAGLAFSETAKAGVGTRAVLSYFFPVL